jgi:hypothetical protein
MPKLACTFNPLKIITMTIKTFWTIFLKIFGLYLSWQTLIILASLFPALFSIGNLDRVSMFTTFSYFIFLVLILIFVTRYCIFKTAWIIEKLHLERGFAEGERVEVNIHRSSLLNIAIIVLGGLILADALPMLVRDCFNYIQQDDAYTGFKKNHSSPYLIGSVLKTTIGYIMVANSRLIVNMIERKRRKMIVEKATAHEND